MKHFPGWNVYNEAAAPPALSYREQSIVISIGVGSSRLPGISVVVHTSRDGHTWKAVEKTSVAGVVQKEERYW